MVQQAGLFPGFRVVDVDAGGVAVHAVVGGAGPPLLLLRGYGESGKPATDERHAPYAKREMARDLVAAMAALGHPRFRLAMYERTDMAFARAYWHWFFLIQPAPFPETLIGADPGFYLRKKMGSGSAGLAPFDPAAWAEYERRFTPEVIHASCEDYRAAATIDLEHDRADREAGRRIACPVHALWGAVSEAPVTGRALPAGHYLPEEAPGLVADEFESFFGD
ncbi:MAG: alpha/beta hydrolase [Burkholderiales bacterium]|jgi:haloacetate dehalogenase|nr:alpha/beta hydrolase [Burkholderiales bacterium]